MARLLSLVAVLLAVALAAALVHHLADGPPVDPYGAGDEAGHGATEEASLAGRTGAQVAPDAPSPFADERDLRVLVQRSGKGNAAEARLIELAREDPAILAELVAWLHPDFDDDRVRPLPPGAMRSSNVRDPELHALGGTLVRLAPDSVPLLIDALSHEEPELRARVASVLGRIGPAADAAVPALVERLAGDEEDLAARIAMLEALTGIGSTASAASSVLLDHLRDDRYPDDARAASVAAVFAAVGPTPETLDACGAALRDGSYEVCTRLVPQLGELGADAAALAGDLRALALDRTAADAVRMAAAEALGRVETGGGIAQGILLDVAFTEDEETWIRASAMLGLARLGGEATKSLLERLRSADPEIRCLAVTTLAGAGLVEGAALLALLEPLRTVAWRNERWWAFRAGAEVEAPAEVLVPWFAAWLEDEDASLRREALGRLARLPDDSGRVIGCLVAFLDEEELAMRRWAMVCLCRRAAGAPDDAAAQRKAEVVDAVRARLGDEDRQVREDAALWLSRMAPACDAEALPVWIEALASGSFSPELLPVLRRMGPKARPALPALEAVLAEARGEALREELRRTIVAVR